MSHTGAEMDHLFKLAWPPASSNWNVSLSLTQLAQLKFLLSILRFIIFVWDIFWKCAQALYWNDSHLILSWIASLPSSSLIIWYPLRIRSLGLMLAIFLAHFLWNKFKSAVLWLSPPLEITFIPNPFSGQAFIQCFILEHPLANFFEDHLLPFS